MMCRLEFVTVKEASETMRQGRLASLYASYLAILESGDLGIWGSDAHGESGLSDTEPLPPQVCC